MFDFTPLCTLEKSISQLTAERRRSRSEMPWETMTTIAQCRQSLEESHWKRPASLVLAQIGNIVQQARAVCA